MILPEATFYKKSNGDFARRSLLVSITTCHDAFEHFHLLEKLERIKGSNGDGT